MSFIQGSILAVDGGRTTPSIKCENFEGSSMRDSCVLMLRFGQRGGEHGLDLEPVPGLRCTSAEQDRRGRPSVRVVGNARAAAPADQRAGFRQRSPHDVSLRIVIVIVTAL